MIVKNSETKQEEIKNNKMRQEEIMKRCEEILINDVEYQQLNKKIVEMENKFKKTLSQEQLAAYIKLEYMVMDQKTRAEELLYYKGTLEKI